MSKYTTEVRYICEEYAGYDESQDYPKVNEIISAAIPHIFEDFPIFDESYREVLETKILRHYYTREIGFETVALWKFHLNTKLNEIMPYYNRLYKANTFEFNPFYDVNLTRTHTGKSATGVAEGETATGHSTGDSESTGTSKGSTAGQTVNNLTTNSLNKFSETPQGGLEGLRNDTYLTSATMDENNNISTENRTGTTETETSDKSATYADTSSNRNLNRDVNTTEDYVETVIGKQGGTSYAKMYKEYMDAMINLDMRVINDLAPLFMNLW